MFHGCFSCLSSLFLLISVFLLVSCDLNDRERRHNDNSNNSQVESKRQALTALGPLDDGVVLAGFDDYHGPSRTSLTRRRRRRDTGNNGLVPLPPVIRLAPRKSSTAARGSSNKMMKDFLGGIEFLVKEAKKLVGENKGEKQKGLLRQTKSEENPKTDLMPLKKSAEKPAARKVMKKDNGKLQLSLSKVGEKPVGFLPGIGDAYSKRLAAKNFATVNDLHAKFIELGKDEEKLAEWLNTEVGMYHNHARKCAEAIGKLEQ